MTDRTSIFDDHRFDDTANRAKRELLRLLAGDADGRGVAGRPPTPDEEALLTATTLVVDELHARLRHLGDSLRAPILELFGLRPRPSTAARTVVLFWFLTPLPGSIHIPRHTEVAGGPAADAVVFTTTRSVRVAPNRVTRTLVDRAMPAVLVGLAEPAGNTVVALTGTAVSGTGLDSTSAAAIAGRDGTWECWDGEGWRRCWPHDTDHTNPNHTNPDQPHTALVEIPTRHEATTIGGHRAAWLRWRPRPAVRLSPTPPGFTVRTVAAAVGVVHARQVVDEPLGVSDGSPGQRFRPRGAPTVVANAPDPSVEVDAGDGWTAWTLVSGFTDSGPDDRHVLLDAATGEVRFGPAIREPDGRLRRYGATPPAGAVIRIRGYWVGGGTAGNVAKGELNLLRTPIPGVRVRVENPIAGSGGNDGESEADLWRRAPLTVRANARAVTAADHEELARRADPDVARAYCVRDSAAATVRVLLVPEPPRDRADRPELADLLPSTATLRRVASHLDRHRLLGVSIVVEPPSYQGVSVAAEVIATSGAGTARAEILAALYGFLHPLTGGWDAAGWPFGHPVTEGAVAGVLHRLPVVREVASLTLYPVDLASGARSAPHQIQLVPTALPVSVDHDVQIRVR